MIKSWKIEKCEWAGSGRGDVRLVNTVSQDAEVSVIKIPSGRYQFGLCGLQGKKTQTKLAFSKKKKYDFI